MSENSFISSHDFATLFRAGRFKPKPTIQVLEISGCAGSSIEAVIANDEGDVLGCCWQGDFEKLIQLAAVESDTALSNPNIHVVNAAIKEMKIVRERVQVLERDIARQLATTVVPFQRRPH